MIQLFCDNLRFYITVFIIASITNVSSVYAFEKSGTTSFQFLSVRPSARAAALSGTFTTIVNNSEACFWNPAGLTRISDMDFSSTYIDYFLDVKMFSFSAGMTTHDYGSLGIFALYSDVGEIEVTTTAVGVLDFRADKSFNPGLTGEVYRPTQFVGGISYAASLTESFSFGISAKYVQEDLVFKKASALIFDGGLLFNTGYKSIVIGAALKNFGQDVKFVEKKYPIPQTLNIGVSANLVGAAHRSLFMESEENSLLFAYDLVQPRDFDQQHTVGIEYSYDKIFIIRGGYNFNGDQASYSAGAGINYMNMRIDYSYNPMGDYLPAIHRISIGYELR